MTTAQIYDLLMWSDPRTVMTHRGPKALLLGRPTQRFREAWQAHKEELKRAGIEVTKNRDGWWVAWYTDIETAYSDPTS